MVTLREPPSNDGDRLLTVAEVAAHLGYAVQTIYNKVNAGGIPCVRLGRRTLRFRLSEIEEWVRQQNEAAQESAA